VKEGFRGSVSHRRGQPFTFPYEKPLKGQLSSKYVSSWTTSARTVYVNIRVQWFQQVQKENLGHLC
jgi:hypothetical protein